MGKFGPMIREIRLAKGMTLNELARDIVSVPFLSKYERGTSDISAENFFQLLDRLNVRLSEFEALNANLKQETQDSFLEKYSYAANNDNLILLNQLLADEKQYYQQSANIRHLHNQIILKQYINNMTHLPYNQEDSKVIKEYLLQVEDWRLYEIELFGNSIFFLPLATVEFLVKTAIKKTYLLDRISNNKHVLAQVIANVITRMIEADELMKARQLIELGERQLTYTKFYYEKTYLHFFEGYCLLKEGKELGENYCQQAIDVMKTLKDYETANHLTSYLDEHGFKL